MNNFISCERKNKMPKIECVVLNAVKDLVFILSECEGWFNSFSSGNSSIAFHLVNISYRTIHYVKKYY